YRRNIQDRTGDRRGCDRGAECRRNSGCDRAAESRRGGVMAATGVDKLFDELGKMSVLELVELKKKIEDEWGITAAAPVAVAAAGGAPAAGGDGDVEEQTAFDVVLTGPGDKKIQVIK